MATNRIACEHCGLIGCDCEKYQVCRVCRRAQTLCICRSHAAIPARRPESPTGDAVPARTLEGKIAEAMAYYYDRDAIGLQRFLRQHLGGQASGAEAVTVTTLDGKDHA